MCLLGNDNRLLRLEETRIKTASVPIDETKNRTCPELGESNIRECEELVLVYRLSGCIRDKKKVDLNETTIVGAESVNIERKDSAFKVEMSQPNCQATAVRNNQSTVPLKH